MREGVEHKWCSRCSAWKPCRDFNAYINAWDKLCSWCRSCAAEANKKNTYSLEGVFRLMKKSAGPRGRGWSLRFEDIELMWAKQAGLCAYTGQPMTLVPHDPNKMSIDRIDSTKGYETSNVVLCGQRANLMKRDMSVLDFMTTCRAVVDHANRKDPVMEEADKLAEMLAAIDAEVAKPPLPSPEEIDLTYLHGEAQRKARQLDMGALSHPIAAGITVLDAVAGPDVGMAMGQMAKLDLPAQIVEFPLGFQKIAVLKDGVEVLPPGVTPGAERMQRLLDQRAADVKAGKILEYDEEQRDVPPMLRKKP